MQTYFNQLQSKNYLKDYSNNHFIIRAIMDDKEEIKARLSQFQPIPINNISFTGPGNPVISQQRGLFDCSPDNFTLNSAKVIEFLHNFFGSAFDGFIREQLAAGKKNYTDEKFFQAMSEVHLLSFLATCVGKVKNKIYEPRIGNNGKNPEACFEFDNGTKINIEVKTPDYSQCLHRGCSKWIQPAVAYERSYLRLSSVVKRAGYALINPSINKTKDFINSACEKFLPVNNTREFNILAINYYGHPWGDMAIVGGYCSLMNETTGILCSKKTREKLNISKDISRISAFILYQCTADTLLTSDIRYSWPLIRLVRNPLCPDIDFYKLNKMLRFNTTDYLLPKTIGGDITDMRNYIFYNSPDDIVEEDNLVQIYQALCEAQGLFIQS